MTQTLERTAVAFLIFNRPDFTARVFEMIAGARPRQLLVVADGPRAAYPDDVELCRQTRAVINKVDWPCDVLTCYSDVNLGCKDRIASGLDWVFSQVDEAIVIEDDCVPDPTFFPFCEELLTRYRDDSRVHMVSGCNVLPRKVVRRYSYYFSRCYHVWGWASWARAWKLYDVEMRRWPEVRSTKWLEQHLRGGTEAALARAIFDETYAGRVPTWDFQWVFAGWTAAALAVIPAVNLVTNIGYGEKATNERKPNHPLARLPTAPMDFPLRHPSEVAVNEQADREEWRSAYPRYFPGPPEQGWRRAARAMREALAHTGLG